jgi:hypothetical protein
MSCHVTPSLLLFSSLLSLYQERKLQAQRIKLKMELCYFSDQEVPADPERPAKLTQQAATQQLLPSLSPHPPVLIPWRDLTAGGEEDYMEKEEGEKEEGGGEERAGKERAEKGGAGGGGAFDSFEQQLLRPTQSQIQPAEEQEQELESDMLSGLPEYVTVRLHIYVHYTLHTALPVLSTVGS